MAGEWYNQTLRKVHILYVSPAWAKGQGERFSARDYVEGMRTANVDLVQLYGKDHHGYCYYRARAGRPYPRDVFGELIPEVRRAGMRFVGYFSVGLDAWAIGMYPEWAAMDRDGRPFERRPFLRACLNSGYREFALAQFEDMVTGYELDGAWLDIIPLSFPAPGIGYAVQYPVPCYCPACCRLYRARFGEDLPLDPTPEQRRAVYAFMIDGVRGLLDEAKAILNRHQPDALFTYNFARGWADPVANADLVSIEGHAPLYARQSLVSRWGRASGKPFEILTPGGLATGPGPNGFGGWNNWDDKPAEVLRIEAGIAAAHGGSAVFGVAPYPDGSVAAGQWALLGEVFRDLERIEAHCVNPESAAEVAIVLATRPRTAPETWTDQVAEVQTYHEALRDGQVQFDVIAELASLDRYRLVIVPDQPALTDVEIATLREYVRAGGYLLVSGRTSLWDEHGQPRADFGLADVMGVRFRATLEDPFAFLRVDPTDDVGAGIPDMPLLVAHRGIAVDLDGAEELGQLAPPETARTNSTTVLWGSPPPDDDRASPGITRHGFGEGACVYVAIPLAVEGLGGVWVKHLIRNAVAALLPTPILRANVPPGVEVVLNRQGERWVLHVVNCLVGQPNHVAIGADRAALRQIEVELDAARIGAITTATLAPDEPIAIAHEDGRYRLTIPFVGIHGVVALR